MITGTNVSAFSMLKVGLSDHPFAKDDIFGATVKFPPRGTPIGMVAHYCDNHKTSYVYQSTKNTPRNILLPARNKTNAWILIIIRKETPTVQ